MSIKKVVMYVEMDDDEILADDYYQEWYDEYTRDGYSRNEAAHHIAESALELVMQDIFYDDRFVSNYDYDIEDVHDEDKSDLAYQRLIEGIEKRDTASDEEE